MQPLAIPHVPAVIAYGGLFVFAVSLLFVFWNQHDVSPAKKRIAFGVVFALVLAVRLFAAEEGQPVLGLCHYCQGRDSSDPLWWIFGCFSCG